MNQEKTKPKNTASLRSQHPKAFRLLTEEALRHGKTKKQAEMDAEMEIKRRLTESPDPTDRLS